MLIFPSTHISMKKKIKKSFWLNLGQVGMISKKTCLLAAICVYNL